MKNLLFALLLIFPFALTEGELNIAAITKAISEGDADGLGQYFDDSVEVAVKDEEGTYAKAEAIKVVRNFFAKNKPTRFSQVHQGASKGQFSEYCIGDLSTQTGTFRVYIYMKVNAGKYTIQEIRFDN